MQMVDGGKDDQDESRKEAERLEGICKHQCADASTTGVEPNQQYHHHHIHRKWDAGRGEDELL